ncbi:hypothetical protein [Flavobacterium sp. 3-210]
MADLANIKEHLKYCGNSCAHLAKYKITLEAKVLTPKSEKPKTAYRCEDHKNKGTNGKKITNQVPFDQSEKLLKVNEFLQSLVGRNIHSRFHTARHLRVKYLKENGGVMCFQEHSKKWKYVYYNQIDSILN